MLVARVTLVMRLYFPAALGVKHHVHSRKGLHQFCSMRGRHESFPPVMEWRATLSYLIRVTQLKAQSSQSSAFKSSANVNSKTGRHSRSLGHEAPPHAGTLLAYWNCRQPYWGIVASEDPSIIRRLVLSKTTVPPSPTGTSPGVRERIPLWKTKVLNRGELRLATNQASATPACYFSLKRH